MNALSNGSAIEAVVFDLDGTLLDTAPDFYIALNRMRQEHQLEPLPNEIIREQVSNGANALVELGFSHINNSERQPQLRAELLEYYLGVIGQHTLFFPGIIPLLDLLAKSQIPWGIATNKPKLYTEALLEKITFPTAPAIVICPEDVTHRKPHPESLTLAASQLGCQPEALIYLGDHARDIECGNRAGSTTIACGYGYIEKTSPIDQWGADHQVNDANELVELITSLPNFSRSE